MATTIDSVDDIVESVVRDYGVGVHRGPVDDVLGRIASAVVNESYGFIVHAYGDNPFVDISAIDTVVDVCRDGEYDYCYAVNLPLGICADVYSKNTLSRIEKLASNSTYREHINAYLFDHIDNISSQECAIFSGIQDRYKIDSGC